MANVSIKYENLDKTISIENRINKKVNKLSKFINDNSQISVTVIDNTPHKGSSNVEYKVLVNIDDIGIKTKNYSFTNSNKDLYLCIDKVMDIAEEKLRRIHDKKTDRFKDYKNQLTEEELD